MSYNSKYTGQQVEALLDIVSQGGGTGGEDGEVQKTTETEILAMGFTKNEGTIIEVKMNGVSKGTSGVVDLGNVITEHQDISGKVDKVMGKQLSTEDFTTALKQKLEGLSNYDDAEINAAVSALQTQLNTLVSGNTNDAINSFNEIIAFLDGIKDNQDLSSIIASIEQQIASKMDKVILANVATSGSYNDLNDKPTIPSAVTESTVSGWGFTKNTGTYSKPSTGIPKSDLASAVQTSLGKADTALQSYTEQYKGTVTGVKINGTTKNPSSGVVDLGTVITSHQDISGKQDKLVSGTNIKTINGTSILGSGNIVIEGGSGGGSSSGESSSKEVVNIYSDTIDVLEPNKIYIFESSSLIFNIDYIEEPADSYAEYSVILVAEPLAGGESISPTITLPSDVEWANGVTPDLTKQGIYELSIVWWSGMTNGGYNAVLTRFD